MQTLCTVLSSACSLVTGFICFTSLSSAVKDSDRISMQCVISQAFRDSLPLQSRFHHSETCEKRTFFCFYPLQHVVSLAGSFEVHLQHLSELSLLHTQKRYNLSLSVCRTISLLTFSKAEPTLIISFCSCCFQCGLFGILQPW